MKHYVNLAFRAEAFSPQLLQETEDILALACGEIPGFRKFELLKDNQWSESNRNVLLVLEFANNESLETYIKHHLHIQLLQIVKPHLAGKAIFDGLI